MDAREYLNQLKKLDKLIENKLVEKEQWKAIATSTTQQMSADRVQSSGNPQKMADAVLKIVDMEAEIDACIDRFVDTKRDVTRTIEQLNADEYDLLHKVYVQYLTLYEYAEHTGKAYNTVKSTHGSALNKVRFILAEREKLSKLQPN